MNIITNIHWAAGFLEGEGSFAKCSRSPLVTASQVQEAPLERMRAAFGGYIRSIKRPEGSRRQDYYRWDVYGCHAIALMLTVYPLMCKRRRDQIKGVIDWWRGKTRERLRWNKYSYLPGNPHTNINEIV